MKFSLLKLFTIFTLVCMSIGMYQVGKYQGKSVGFVENQQAMEKCLRSISYDDLAWTKLQESINESKEGLPTSLQTFPQGLLGLKLDSWWFLETCATLLVLYLCLSKGLTTA